MADRSQEIAEEDEQAVQLDQEASERPAEENEENSKDEGRCAFELLAAGEEGESLFDADDEGQADEEEDLGWGLVGDLSAGDSLDG